MYRKIEFAKSVDYGNTSEFFVDGLASVEHPSPNTTRLNFFTRHRPSGEEGEEHRLVISVRIDTAILADVVVLLQTKEPKQPTVTDTADILEGTQFH